MKHFSKTLFAVFLMLITAMKAAAIDFASDGIYYNILSADDFTVEVTKPERGTYSGEITIPREVTYSNITYTVTAIGNEAFQYADISKIEIPNTITSIGFSAFCQSTIPQIEIPDSVTMILGCAFSSCKNLTEVIVPNTVTRLDYGVFDRCSNLTKVELPNTITKLEMGLFMECSSLTEVKIPDTVSAILTSAFYGCSSITNIEIPNSVASIYETVFCDCTSLTEIVIPNSVTRNIGDGAFKGCTSLTYVEIPYSVPSLGAYVFAECVNLKEIKIPEDHDWMTTIDGGIYKKDGHTLLAYPLGRGTDICLPETLETIYSETFSGLLNADAIYMSCTTPPSYGPDFEDVIYENTILYVPVGTLDAYKSSDIWKNFANIVEKDYSRVIGIVEEECPAFTISNGIITINDYEGELKVYDAKGKLVYYGTDSSISGLSNGIYIIQAGQKTMKIVI